MNWFKFFSRNNKEILSSKEDPKCICWQYSVSNQMSETSKIKVGIGQLVLLIQDQKIKAILEQGDYPINCIIDSPIDNKVLKALKFLYFSTKIFTGERWGTATPIVVEDANLGRIFVKAHGTFAYKLDNPKKLWRQMDSSIKQLRTEDLIQHLRSIILSAFSSSIRQIPNLSFLLQNQKILEENITTKLQDEFIVEGLQLEKFLIQNLSYTENQLKASE